MLLSSFQRRIQNQYVAGFSAALTVMMSGTTFVWPTPILHLLDKEKYKDVLIPMTETEISWMISVIEFGSLFPPIISGVLADVCGRKPSILIAGPFIIAGWIIILMTRDVSSLYIVRILHGFAMGSLFTTVPMYLGEIAEPRVRGSLTALLQAMWYMGFLLQYLIGSFLSYDNSAIVNLCLSTVIFLFFFVSQPETPYYLAMKKCDDQAARSLMLLRGKSSVKEVETETQNVKDCIENDMKNKLKWSDTFKLSKIDFKILMIVQVLAFLRLGSGTISIGAYLSEISRLIKLEFLSVKATMAVYGIITLISIIVATLFIDSLGRRPLLILSCVGTGICTFTLGCFFYLDEYNEAIDLSNVRWLPILILFIFTLLFAIGLAPATQTIQSELFPTNIKALGNIVTTYNLTVTSFLCLRSYQIMVDFLGVFSNFFIFSGINFLGAIFVYFYLPETKGKTFLEISEFFSRKNEILPTKNSVNTRL